jgi:hypothetical protein
MNKLLFKAPTCIIALAGMICLTASCEKIGFSRQIRFNVVTAVPGASADTKTAYSGDVTGSGVERINWTSGDVIRIASDVARTADARDFADYAVTAGSIEADGIYSNVKVGATGADGTGLEWGSGDHHFWGIYPSHPISISGSTATVSGLSIAAAQDVSDSRKTATGNNTLFAPDMTSAWMLADKADVPANTSNFDLLFYPAFTAFEFTLASQFPATLKVKSFELSSEAGASGDDLAGTFSASIAPADATTYTVTSGTRSVTVSFGEGVDITQDKSLRFTVLALPKGDEDGYLKRLTLDFLININGADVHRSLALTSTGSTVPKDGGNYIKFAARHKHRIYGLALPSGDLKLTQVVSPWTVGADYDYISPVTPSLQCWGSETYYRYDTDSDPTDWDGSHIEVSYGYSWSGQVIVTDDPAGYQTENNIPLRPYYSPILELATTSDPVNVLQLQLDNPRFKFIQYGNLDGDPTHGIDISAIDHNKTDHLDIASGAGVKTFFSVVPVEQFTVDETDKTCRVSLLSLSPGILHEISFNVVGGSDPAAQSLPGEGMNELKFMYFGPAVYGTTGVLKP